MDAAESNTKKVSADSSWWDHPLVRLGLFLGTFFAAMVFMRNPVFILFFYAFPAGLFAWLARPPKFWDVRPWILPGYLIYLALLIPGTVVRRRVFKILYAVFIILLIANLAGCNYYVNNYIYHTTE